MIKNDHAPETPATKFLKTHRIPFSNHLYAYEEHGGTKVSARELNVDEHAVVKTLVFEDENAKPLIVLMHGDHKVSAKELARQIGCKKVDSAPDDRRIVSVGSMDHIQDHGIEDLPALVRFASRQ